MYRVASFSFTLLLALLIASVPALGQPHHTSTAATSTEPISVSELEAAAELYVRIELLHAIYGSKLMRADTPDERATVKAKEEQETEDMIQKSSLSAERYETILRAADRQDRLQKQLLDRIEAARDRI